MKITSELSTEHFYVSIFRPSGVPFRSFASAQIYLLLELKHSGRRTLIRAHVEKRRIENTKILIVLCFRIEPDRFDEMLL